jgi:hypothetical protein
MELASMKASAFGVDGAVLVALFAIARSFTPAGWYPSWLIRGSGTEGQFEGYMSGRTIHILLPSMI